MTAWAMPTAAWTELMAAWTAGLMTAWTAGRELAAGQELAAGRDWDLTLVVASSEGMTTAEKGVAYFQPRLKVARAVVGTSPGTRLESSAACAYSSSGSPSVRLPIVPRLPPSADDACYLDATCPPFDVSVQEPPRVVLVPLCSSFRFHWPIE